MSYRCARCNTVCNHQQIKHVTEVREQTYKVFAVNGRVQSGVDFPRDGKVRAVGESHGLETAREEALCVDCDAAFIGSAEGRNVREALDAHRERRLYKALADVSFSEDDGRDDEREAAFA